MVFTIHKIQGCIQTFIVKIQRYNNNIYSRGIPCISAIGNYFLKPLIDLVIHILKKILASIDKSMCNTRKIDNGSHPNSTVDLIHLWIFEELKKNIKIMLSIFTGIGSLTIQNVASVVACTFNR